jgi:hypothetical protein
VLGRIAENPFVEMIAESELIVAKKKYKIIE